jgi:antitoxin (DNA-binding transcriptional repressor) of toxin-antitoxin stability system
MWTSVDKSIGPSHTGSLTRDTPGGVGRSRRSGGDLVKELSMKTVGIRELNAKKFQQLVRAGKLAGITSDRVLVGVFSPIGDQWLDHLLQMNHSRLIQSIDAGEKSLANEKPLTTLDDLDLDATATGPTAAIPPSGKSPVAEVIENPLAAAHDLLALVGGLVKRHSEEKEAAQPPLHRTIRIGDLGKQPILDAGKTGQMLVVTNRGQMLGIIIPVTQRLVAHMIETNLSRLRRTIPEGEADLQLGATHTLTEILQTAVLV